MTILDTLHDAPSVEASQNRHSPQLESSRLIELKINLLLETASSSPWIINSVSWIDFNDRGKASQENECNWRSGKFFIIITNGGFGQLVTGSSCFQSPLVSAAGDFVEPVMSGLEANDRLRVVENCLLLRSNLTWRAYGQPYSCHIQWSTSVRKSWCMFFHCPNTFTRFDHGWRGLDWFLFQ